jgi:hypothetical protein
VRERIINFINNKKQYPILAAIASGLYPLLYYYNANFTQVDSWGQLTFFIALFILLPIAVFITFYFLTNKIKKLFKYQTRILTVLNLSWFGFLILLSTLGLSLKLVLSAFLIAVVFGFIFHKQLKKIIVFQFLLAFIVFLLLIPNIIRHITYSKEWMQQPDDILSVKFKQTPNIYLIQVDGYANFTELDKGYYNFDNSNFNEYLKDSGFKLYEDYRSNYFSTLSSNSSLFTMKHHYYSNPKKAFSELLNARNVIVTDNPVLQILKHNNYKTHLLMEKAYLLINRPEIGYDYCNVDYSEVSYLDRGFWVVKALENDLETVLPKDQTSNNFYFIQKLLPSHVSNTLNSTAKIEREHYLKKLEEANIWVKNLVAKIEEKDKKALIIISADHGGFVGFNSTLETEIKQTDRDLIYSIFTSTLAIKWNNNSPEFDSKFKTPVNFFRILFSYLSENVIYLNELQEDKSYIIIGKDAPFGVYEYIDENGNVVFNRIDN